DETQEVARAYGAQCTPDFFGFNARDELQYRGRLDAGRTAPVAGARRDLYEAMKLVAGTQRGPAGPIARLGCSVQWREGGRRWRGLPAQACARRFDPGQCPAARRFIGLLH